RIYYWDFSKFVCYASILRISTTRSLCKNDPLNLYALAALLLVFLVAYFNVDIGPMKVHERRAVKDKDPVGPNNQNIPGDLSDMFSPHEHGKVYHLVIPIVVLIV